MKRYIAVLLMAASLCCPLQAQDKPVMVKDSADQAALERFRTMGDPLPATVSAQGLSEVHASGSAQISAGNLAELQHKLAGHDVWVVDLRQEDHGFLNGLPISWFGPHNWANVGKSTAAVLQQEQLDLQTLHPDEVVTLPHHKDGTTEKVKVTTVQSESQLLKPTGFHYLRMAVTDHSRPDDKTVDEFVAFARDLPSKSWLHLHCAGGMGRTTSFLAMVDMMHNSQTVSFEDIVTRQKLLGGEDLMALPAPEDFNYKPKSERLAFIHQFYQYCRDNHDGFKTSWSQWLAANKP